jgi:hypothetical protein
MSLVLQFEMRARESRVSAVQSGPAEIIIFPGVRFERLDVQATGQEPDTPTTPAAGQSLSRIAK